MLSRITFLALTLIVCLGAAPRADARGGFSGFHATGFHTENFSGFHATGFHTGVYGTWHPYVHPNYPIYTGRYPYPISYPANYSYGYPGVYPYYFPNGYPYPHVSAYGY